MEMDGIGVLLVGVGVGVAGVFFDDDLDEEEKDFDVLADARVLVDFVDAVRLASSTKLGKRSVVIVVLSVSVDAALLSCSAPLSTAAQSISRAASWVGMAARLFLGVFEGVMGTITRLVEDGEGEGAGVVRTTLKMDCLELVGEGAGVGVGLLTPDMEE